MSDTGWKEERDIPENEMCGLLDATMDVVADFASMLANGIYDFISTVRVYSLAAVS